MRTVLLTNILYTGRYIVYHLQAATDTMGPGKNGPGKKGPGKKGPIKRVQVKTVLGKNGPGKKGPPSNKLLVRER